MSIAIPLTVLNRLRLGRQVAATVAARSADNRAWLVITPVFHEDANWTSDSSWEWSEGRLAGNRPEEQITGFQIARIEIPADVVEQIRDDDLPPGAALVEKVLVTSEWELSEVIGDWLPDPANLRHPDNVPDTSLVLFRLGPLTL